MEPEPTKSNLRIPIMIVLAGVTIVLAILLKNGTLNFTRAGTVSESAQTPPEEATAPQYGPLGPGNSKNVKPLSAEDHILGNPNARVKVIEFSDFECPACKAFHPIMISILKEYGLTSQVAWIYRHLPIDTTHPKARKEAEASECANELGGNEKFWQFAEKIFDVTPSNNNLDLRELPKIAESIGLDVVQFNACLEGGTYAQHVQADLEDAINSGASGTPYIIVIAPNGQIFALSGAQSYPGMKRVIEKALTLDGKK